MTTSRVARKPIDIPTGVNVRIEENVVHIKGSKGELNQPLPQGLSAILEDGQLKIVAIREDAQNNKLAGTMRALVSNHVEGVSKGFSKKLKLSGVGYRAQVTKNDNLYTVNLTLGLSHPAFYTAPEGIILASAAVTEIEVTGIDKQKVGQVAANIRGIGGGIRKPEPYKLKGIQYADEILKEKEIKKKK